MSKAKNIWEEKVKIPLLKAFKKKHQPITKLYAQLKYDENGEEIMDPRPVTVDVGLKRPKSLQEQIMEVVNNAKLQQDMEQAGYDSFEEFNNWDGFEDDMEGMLESKYEIKDMPVEVVDGDPGYVNMEPKNEPTKDSTEPSNTNASTEPVSGSDNTGGPEAS